MNIRLRNSIKACLKNSRRLLDDSEYLESCETPTTSHYLALIAQEETAKAFLLTLVVRDIIPWDPRLLRALRDHRCKQLICIIMDYLAPDTDEFIERCNAVVLRHERPQIPAIVIDAIAILRHEKIGRWVQQKWAWTEIPKYDKQALAAANGRRDRIKQDALYVRLARDGGVASYPSCGTLKDLRAEQEQAERFNMLAEGLLDGKQTVGLDYARVGIVFRSIFASVPQDA